MMMVRDVLSDESKWIKKREAVNAKGDPVAPRSKEATRWCLMGAIMVCTGGAVTRAQLIAAVRAALPIRYKNPWEVVAFNDAPATTWEDVKVVLDELAYHGM